MNKGSNIVKNEDTIDYNEYYPMERGQMMLVKPNRFEEYSDLNYRVVVLIQVNSTENGVIAHCTYYDEEKGSILLDIPLYLLWRIADDEDLLEMHENYMHSVKISQCKNQVTREVVLKSMNQP